MRLLARVTTAALLAVTPALAGSAAAAAPEPTPAPLIASTDAVPGRYIVTLGKGVDAGALARKLGLKPRFLYRHALNGFAVPMTRLQLEAARKAAGVKTVEEDTRISAMSDGPHDDGRALGSPTSLWGLDRIDQRALPLDGDFTTTANGAGVTAYILDTGIDYGHDEFGGRATFGFDAVGDGRQGMDCQGHGTHVAGTVGGKTYGVAPEAALVAVRVMGCDGTGSYSDIIAGMDWVANNAKQPAVLNSSLGGPWSEAVNNAANALSDRGVLPVVAAGNSSEDACDVSPASADRVVTVAASNRGDEETSFSNYGRCVSLYAPGQDITSAKLGGGSVALNGTSMASPHVTGVAVLYKQAHPAATPAEVAEFLADASTKDVLTGVSAGSPNRLLFTNGL